MKRALALLPLLLTGCAEDHSAVTNPAGPHAALTGDLFWGMFAVNTAVFFLVLGFLFTAIARRRTAVMAEPLAPVPDQEQRLGLGVALAVAATIIVLTGFVGFSYATDKKLTALDAHSDMQIEVTGHQWWWELRYIGDKPSDTFTAANEIHVPVGATVRLKLHTADVIHSFWVPNLAGKRDIIPGEEEQLVIRADKPGKWEGRCAEFCGMQHAFMQLTVYAEPKDKFEAWAAAQRKPAATPATPEQQHGEQVFSGGPCAMCHALRTTTQGGFSSNAPDLTHLKSRAMIGAGAAPNTKGYLGGWIIDPQGIKPGVHMPTILQNPDDFQALLAYLETLK